MGHPEAGLSLSDGLDSWKSEVLALGPCSKAPGVAGEPERTREGSPRFPHRAPLNVKASSASILLDSVYITSLLGNILKPLALPPECNSLGLEINKFSMLI